MSSLKHLMNTLPTSSSDPGGRTVETSGKALSGWLMLPVNLGLFLAGIAVFIAGVRRIAATDHFSWLVLLGPLVVVAAIILLCGHFTLQPNEARVMILFGEYRGTIRRSGFFWANPFFSSNRGRIERTGPPQKNPRTGQVETPHRVLSSKISRRDPQLQQRASSR
jgi:hypothetical protein